jgi:dTDP-4-amino-4,6-dideoxygalactose transaminase
MKTKYKKKPVDPGSEKVRIPFFDLSRQYAKVGAEVEVAARAVFRSGKYVLSPEVESFERKFSEYSGVRYGIGCGSGTDALIFALKAVGVGEGDEVIVPSYTFVATVFAVLHLGAVPVFADVCLETCTLDPAAAARAISPRTKAILPVHLFGRMADMEALAGIAARKKLKLVEDAAQAHGATWKAKMAGVLSDAACYSFYPTKNLGACGDGGMVVTQKEDVAGRVRGLRNLGRKTHFEHAEPGWTSRLDAVQSAVLSVKLKYLDAMNLRRARIADAYRNGLSGTPVALPSEIPDCRHVYHVFAVRIPGGQRDALRSRLQERGISTMVHYAVPVHRQAFYSLRHDRPWDAVLKRTLRLSEETLSLPMFPEMKDSEVSYVCGCIRDFFSKSKTRKVTHVQA